MRQSDKNHPGKNHPGKKQTGKRRAESARRRTVLFGIIAAGAAVLLIVLINSFLRRTVDRYDSDIIISGVSVGETDVSGMTAGEAKAAVTEQTEQTAGGLIIFAVEDGREARATLRELGISVKDLDEMIARAVDYGKKGDLVDRYKILKASEKGKKKKFPVKYQVTENSAAEVLRTRTSGILKAPVNAAVTQENGNVVIRDDVPGEALDLKKTVAAVNDLISDGFDESEGRVTAVLMEAQADIVTEDLEVITDVLGTFSTDYSSSSEGRKKNVESGAGHIGGILLKPGEEQSVSELTAPYTEENGYAPAPSYEGNAVVESMGGGICQVSTTLYNALLRAEIEITERYEHSMMVSYVEPSMDAAIAEGVKDLKFKNNLDDPIYIEALAENGTLTFNIYGKEYRSSGRTVEYESETLETIEPENTTYVAVDESIGTMYTQSGGSQGHTAQLWKIVFENGTETSREAINYSYYLASDSVVAVGTASQDEDETAKMKDAVASQNEETIKAAINSIMEERNRRDQSEESEDETGGEENGEEETGETG